MHFLLLGKINAQSSRQQSQPNLRCNKLRLMLKSMLKSMLKPMLNPILMLTILTSKPLNSFVLDSPFSTHSCISTSHNRQQIHLPQTPFWFVVILLGSATFDASFQYRVCLVHRFLFVVFMVFALPRPSPALPHSPAQAPAACEQRYFRFFRMPVS